MKIQIELTDKAVLDKLFSMYVKHMQIRTNVLNFISNMVAELSRNTPVEELTPEYFERMRRTFSVLKVRKESNFSQSECHELIEAVLQTYIDQSKSGNRPVVSKFITPDLTKQYQMAKELIEESD